MVGPSSVKGAWVVVCRCWRLESLWLNRGTPCRHRWIAGVCGGLADWLGWNPTLVRFLYVVVSIVSVGFPGTIVYIVLWIVVPKEPN